MTFWEIFIKAMMGIVLKCLLDLQAATICPVYKLLMTTDVVAIFYGISQNAPIIANLSLLAIFNLFVSYLLLLVLF